MSENESDNEKIKAQLEVKIKGLEGIKDLDKQVQATITETFQNMNTKIDELQTIITKQETERELAKYDKQRSEKMTALEKWPALVEKHKETKDLNVLQTAIDTANEVEGGFPEYEAKKKKDDDKDKFKMYVTPKIIK